MKAWEPDCHQILCVLHGSNFLPPMRTKISLPPSEGEIVIVNIVFKYRLFMNPFGWRAIKNKLKKSSRAFLKKKITD